MSTESVPLAPPSENHSRIVVIIDVDKIDNEGGYAGVFEVKCSEAAPYERYRGGNFDWPDELQDKLRLCLDNLMARLGKE